MLKIWYIFIDGGKEGPYTPDEIKRHPRITPDTLAWKEGMPQWLPIRSIPELIHIFEDEEAQSLDEKDQKTEKKVKDAKEEVLTLNYEPPSYYFWLLIAVLIILYTLYQWLAVR